MSKQFRQGDCFLEAVKEIPSDAKSAKSRDGRYVLLDGEATGHHHSVAVCDDVEMFERNGELFLRIGKETPLEHQEHATIPLPPGNYRMTRQREYWDEEIRYVQD